MESDMKFGNDLDGSIDWLLANGGKYVEYHTPEHETYAAESGERYLEPVYSHLADRFFLNEDRMFIVGDQVIKNVEDEMLAVNVKEYKDMLGVNSVAEYEANYAPVEVMAYIPEHPSPDDANLAYGQSQYHESVNGNFKMTCEPYVKNYRWALYKAAITGFKMHNYEYSSSRKTWKNKRAKTDYLNSILMGYYFADILYCRSGNKNGSFNAASKKAYQRHYHKNIGMAPNSYPFMNSYTINMSNSKGCIIQIVKEPIFKEWKP